MATYNARAVLPDDEPGPWGPSVPIRYDKRDVLLYAVGIGTEHLGFVFEGRTPTSNTNSAAGDCP